MTTYQDLFDACVALSCGQVIRSKDFTAGPYTPAVRDEDFPFAVIDRRGAVHYLARDAFAAAEYFLEPYGAVGRVTSPLRQTDPAHLVELDLEYRADEIALRVDNWRWAAEQRRKHLERMAAGRPASTRAERMRRRREGSS